MSATKTVMDRQVDEFEGWRPIEAHRRAVGKLTEHRSDCLVVTTTRRSRPHGARRRLTPVKVGCHQVPPYQEVSS